MSEDSLSKAAGEGVTVTLKGEVFKIKPLTIGDLSAFESFIRSQRIKDFMAVAGDLPKDERIKILSELASSTMDEVDISTSMRSMMGVQYLLWRSLKKSHNELTYDEMDNFVDLDNFDDVVGIVEGIGGGNDENPTAAEENQEKA